MCTGARASARAKLEPPKPPPTTITWREVSSGACRSELPRSPQSPRGAAEKSAEMLEVKRGDRDRNANAGDGVRAPRTRRRRGMPSIRAGHAGCAKVRRRRITQRGERRPPPRDGTRTRAARRTDATRNAGFFSRPRSSSSKTAELARCACTGSTLRRGPPKGRRAASRGPTQRSSGEHPGSMCTMFLVARALRERFTSAPRWVNLMSCRGGSCRAGVLPS
jgi:hypothetical protein